MGFGLQTLLFTPIHPISPRSCFFVPTRKFSLNRVFLVMENFAVKNILIWDHDGTIVGRSDPNDQERAILPGVREAMGKAQLNVVISGFLL